MKTIYIVVRYDNLLNYIEGTARPNTILGVYTDKRKAEDRLKYLTTSAATIISTNLNEDCSKEI